VGWTERKALCPTRFYLGEQLMLLDADLVREVPVGVGAHALGREVEAAVLVALELQDSEELADQFEIDLGVTADLQVGDDVVSFVFLELCGADPAGLGDDDVDLSVLYRHDTRYKAEHSWLAQRTGAIDILLKFLDDALLKFCQVFKLYVELGGAVVDGRGLMQHGHNTTAFLSENKEPPRAINSSGFTSLRTIR